jgi:hypothetical protein
MIVWRNAKGKSENYQTLLRRTTEDMIAFNKLSHPLFRNFFVDWMEELNENFHIILDMLFAYFISTF